MVEMNNSNGRSEKLKQIYEYHQATKHSFAKYANGPDNLDWANQPNPFRCYVGAPFLALQKRMPSTESLYDDAFCRRKIPPFPVNGLNISRLLYNSLAISAWKSAGDMRWALRCNPSSGNLHPTEGYLLCGSVDGLCDKPMVSHYAPEEHGLEVRAEIDQDLWLRIRSNFPQETFFIGLTSIYWREAWKYGQRAFRYSQLDVGHAIGAITLAAAGLGWHTAVIDEIGSRELAGLLGLAGQQGPEPEEAEVLIAVGPLVHGAKMIDVSSVDFGSFKWQGKANRLSSVHRDWGLGQLAGAARKPLGPVDYEGPDNELAALPGEIRPLDFETIIRRRRSAVAMDKITRMSRDSFFAILQKVVAVSNPPFSALPWKPQIHPVLFVHRVDDLPPGLYCLVRSGEEKKNLERSFSKIDKWQPALGCSGELPLYLLAKGGGSELAGQISCFQDIAADGCFSLGMLASFKSALELYGPWFYPRLYWEAGLIGQVLYLEAEAAGIRGTGIGCFFDDAMHDLLGINDRAFQDLYHFTVGGLVQDNRLQTLPAYP